MPVKKGNVTLAICFGFFLLCALSMGNRMYLLIAIIIASRWKTPSAARRSTAARW